MGLSLHRLCFRWVVLIAATSVLLIGCGADRPTDNHNSDTAADAGRDVDTDDAYEDAQDDADSDGGGEMRETGESCPSECATDVQMGRYCEHCEEEVCYSTTSRNPEDAYCTRECDDDDDCPESGWICDLAACVDEDAI